MKKSKKAIYAKYGIEYNKGKIFAPVFGWISPLLVNGNAKLGVGVMTFSTLPTNKIYQVFINGVEYLIKGTCPCHCTGCYATKGFYNMPSTVKSLAIKTILARDYTDFAKRAIMAQIEADNVLLLRVHASGDFFSAEYIEAWHCIGEFFPSVAIWTYTKNKDAENAFNDLSNFNVVKSIINGYGFNFGHCDYIMTVYKALKALGKPVYICKCGIDKNQHCNNCTGCRNNPFVLFIEHSTEYKAENDSSYPELKKVIESQTI